MGWARALLDANLPFEIVTERDLAAGLAGRYRVIVLPAHLTLTPAALEHLLAFARAGGRVVADMPMGLYDDHGRLLDSRPGSAFARLFGVSLVDFRNTHNAPERLLGPAGPVTLAGQYAELEALPGGASVAARFANGLPARTEHAVGAGRVVILNGELSRAAHEPGHAAEQAILVAATLGEAGRAKGTGASGAGARNGVATPRWRAEGRGVLVYRRSAPAADHYFFVNDGDARAVTVSVTDRDYRAAEDGVTGEKLATSARALRVPVPARSGRWVRVSRR
jgi:beta-galactosidase